MTLVTDTRVVFFYPRSQIRRWTEFPVWYLVCIPARSERLIRDTQFKY